MSVSLKEAVKKLSNSDRTEVKLSSSLGSSSSKFVELNENAERNYDKALDAIYKADSERFNRTSNFDFSVCDDRDKFEELVMSELYFDFDKLCKIRNKFGLKQISNVVTSTDVDMIPIFNNEDILNCELSDVNVATIKHTVHMDYSECNMVGKTYLIFNLSNNLKDVLVECLWRGVGGSKSDVFDKSNIGMNYMGNGLLQFIINDTSYIYCIPVPLAMTVEDLELIKFGSPHIEQNQRILKNYLSYDVSDLLKVSREI